MGPKTLPTIWEKYLRRIDRRTEVKQYTPPPPSSGKRGYKNEITEINEK
jgi:hypothetical protein